jgi:hypothetical protein
MEAGDHMSQYFNITEPASCSFAAFRPIYLNRKVSPFTIVHDYDDDCQLTLHGEVRSLSLSLSPSFGGVRPPLTTNWND